MKYGCVLLSCAVFLTGIKATAAGEDWNPEGLREQKHQEAMSVAAQEWLADNRIVIPHDVRLAAEKAEKETGISRYLIMATCWIESQCQNNVSNGDCKGLMQVNVVLHKALLNEYGGNWRNTYTNIMAGARLMQYFTEHGAEDAGEICRRYHGEKKPGYSEYTRQICEIADMLAQEDCW